MGYRRVGIVLVSTILLLHAGLAVAWAGTVSFHARIATRAGTRSAPPAHPQVAPMATGASTSTTLPLKATGLAVDDVHQHAFLVGAAGSRPGVAVMNFDGSLNTVIRLVGATNEAMDPTGGVLYVSLQTSGEIDAIDTGTLTVVGTFPLPAEALCPSDLALSSGYVWFSYDCADIDDVGIGRLDPSDGAVQLFPSVAGPFHDALVASPSLPNVLFAGMDQDTPPTIWKFDTTGGDLVQLAARDTHDFSGGADANDFRGTAITPDGRDVLWPSNSTVYALTTSDLSLDTFSYPSGTYSVAAAPTPDGGFVAAGNQFPYGDADIEVFAAGTSSPVASLTTGAATPMVDKGALAFSASGGKLFAIAFQYPGPYAFEVFNGVQYPPGTVTVHVASRSVAFLGKLTVTAHLALPASTSDRRLTITEYPFTGTPTSATGTMGSSHSFSHVFTMHRGATFTASWGGDDVTGPAQAISSSVAVGSRTHMAMLNSYGTSGSYHLYHYSSTCVNDHVTGCPHEQATVAPGNAGSGMCVTTQQYVGGAWANGQTLCGTLSSKSHLTVVIYYFSRGIIGVPFRARGHFQGSSENGASTSGWVYFKVTN